MCHLADWKHICKSTSYGNARLDERRMESRLGKISVISDSRWHHPWRSGGQGTCDKGREWRNKVWNSAFKENEDHWHQLNHVAKWMGAWKQWDFIFIGLKSMEMVGLYEIYNSLLLEKTMRNLDSVLKTESYLIRVCLNEAAVFH